MPDSLLAPLRQRVFSSALPRLSRRFSSRAFERPEFPLAHEDVAVLVYGTSNVGDEMQTIAQLGFLPPNGRFAPVNRDHLDRYRGRRRLVIANGWHTHNPASWPPSPALEPVFVSFHMASEWRPTSADVAYLQRRAPIGCRDLSTVERLKSLGVDAYFTGCLTLTLQNPYQADRAAGPVVVCDADLGYDGGYPPSAHSLYTRLVPAAIRQGAVSLRQEVEPRRRNQHLWKTRKALEHLELYARARLVITTRLHCALPCLALGTPVVFLHQDYDSDPRFDGLREILRGHGPDAREVDIDWADPRPTDISAFRQRVTTHTLQGLATAIERLRQ